jgi:fibronectin-binding autotransporter adhesin
MTNQRSFPSVSSLSLAALTALALLNQSANAATNTWTGGSATTDNWSDAANWGGNPVAAGDWLIFDGSVRLTPNNNLGAGTLFNNLAFGPSAGAFNVGGNAIILTNRLDGGGGTTIGGSIDHGSGSSVTLSLPVTLSAGKHLIGTQPGSGTLNLAGVLTRNNGAVVVFEKNGGEMDVTGSSLANVNGILGGWATLGNDWAAVDVNDSVVPYAGYTDIAAGSIASDPASNVRYTGDTGNLTANSVTVNSILATIGANRNLTNIGTVKLGANGGIYRTAASTVNSVLTVLGGTLTADGGGEITLSDATAGSGFAGTANNLQVTTTVIANDGANPVRVNVIGYVVMSAANTYSGGTYINQGRVQTGNPAAMGTGPVYVFPGGQAFLNNGTTYANAFFLSGAGTTESGGLGAIRAAGRNITNVVTLVGDTVIGCGNNGTINNNRITGKITGPGALIIGNGSNNNGGGTLTVGTAGVTNDYAGDTIISRNTARASALTFTAGAHHVMPHGAGKGNVLLNGAAQTATLDLNGTTQTINGLASSGTTPANGFVESTVAGGMLVLGANNASASFAGTVRNGAGSLGLTKAGNGTQTFTGALTYGGNTFVNAGKLLLDTGSSITASPLLAVSGTGNLDVSAICPLTLGVGRTLALTNGALTVALLAGSEAVTTPTLNVDAAQTIHVDAMPAVTAYPQQFTAIKYSTLNGTPNFALGTLPPTLSVPFSGYVSNNLANSSIDVVITNGPSPLTWVGYSGGAPNSAWDISTTPNWKNAGGGTTTFANGLPVSFNDSASNAVVSLDAVVLPEGISVSNSVLNYSFTGGNYISGASGLSKQGSGTLTLNNSGVNDFLGGVNIVAGTLRVGNNDTAGNLPATGGVANDGALVFARTDDVTVPNIISGSGSVSQTTPATLTLAGANTFDGPVMVTQGTLKAGDNAALGSTNGSTTASSGAALDINGPGTNIRRLGAEPVFVSGAGPGGGGAIVNTGSDTFPALSSVTMQGHTTFGGTGRWDLRVATGSNPADGKLDTGGNAYNLTKVGANQVSLVNITVDPALADVHVQAGTLAFEANTTGLGDPARTLTLESGGALSFFNTTNQLNKKIVMKDGASVINAAGAGTIIGPMQLTNVNAGNYCTFNVGGTSLTLNNVLTGDGTIYKVTGAGHLIIAGSSPNFAGGGYLSAGTTTVSGTLSNALGFTLVAGRLNINGSLLGAGVTSGAGTTVAGSGTMAGNLDASGTVLPGDTTVPATFTTAGLTLQGGAEVTMDLGSSTTPGAGTNDLVVVNGDLTVNANTININPLGLLQIGVPYRLFNYTGNLIWNADLNVVALSGGYTFTWSTNTPGQVNLVASGGPPVWNGGSLVNSLWSSAANWGGVSITPGSPLYFGGVNRLNNTNDTTAGTSYADLAFVTGAGTFTLNGNDITLDGNIVNQSSNPQAIKLAMSQGASRTFNGGSAGLAIGGALTNTANLVTNTLAGTGTLANALASADPNSITNFLSVISNANWTMVDNATATPNSVPVQLDVHAGTFNYGTALIAPVMTNTQAAFVWRIGVTPGIPAIFNMVNGTLVSAPRLNTGAGGGTIAQVNQSGGTLTTLTLVQGSDSSANAYTEFNLAGGTFNIGAPGTPQNFFLASRGTGIVTVASSAVLNCAVLDVSRNAAGNTLGSVGVVNLNGGVLSATRLGTATGAAQAGGTPTATFNFNGGTLKAAASSGAFFQGNASSPTLPITTYVKTGGAIIDDGGFAISVLEPLQHDPALGAAPDGGLRKLGAGTLTMTAASTYNGNTVVSNGTLAINGSLGQTDVVVHGGRLAGTGSVGSNVTINAGGTIAPGTLAALGVLTVAGNASIVGGAEMDLNKSTATNDVLVAANITYGGTLTLTNLAGTLAATDTFKLFSAASYNGAFSALVPATPGPGLGWNTNTLATDGILRLVQTVNTTPTNITATFGGGNVTLAWPASHTGWTLQVQTNSRSVGLNTNWFNVAGSAATNQVSMPVDPLNPTVFFRLAYP